MSSSHCVSSAQSNNSQVLGNCTSILIFKSVCQSQNRKCVCQSQNRKCVCQSQNSHIYRVLLRREDQGGWTMVWDGPNWCLDDCMLRNYYQTWSKTDKSGVIKDFVTDRHFYKLKMCLSVTK